MSALHDDSPVVTAWSSQADRIIRANYSRLPNRRIGQALGRTAYQVVGRARHLGLVKSVVWSARETDLLRKHYRGGDSAALTALVELTGKLRHQVRAKARALGLARVKERRWTPDDDYGLSIMWGRRPDAAVAKKLGRTVDACKIRATRQLHRSRKDGLRGWTGRGIARLFGVDEHKVTRQWLANGWLVASTTAIGAGGNKTLLIEEGALLRFLADYPHEYDWRKVDDPTGYYARIAKEASAGLLTTAELAARYGVTTSGAWAWIAKGWLPAVKGHTSGGTGAWYVRAADLAGWRPPRPELVGHRGRGKAAAS